MSRRPLFFLCVILLASALSCKATPPAENLDEGLSIAKLQALGNRLQRDAEAGKLPGSVLLVMRNGKLVYSHASGQLGSKKHAPMRRDAIFRVYSMTKPLVSVAAMTLIEDGRLVMNDPISRYLPQLRELKVGVEKVDASGNVTLERVPQARQITVQDLLRHTSGFTYGFTGRSLVQAEYRKAGIDRGGEDCNDFLTRLASVPLLMQPSTAYEYGVSTDVLGCLIEKVSGQSLDTYLRERVLAPLGMNDSGFSVPAEKQDRIAEPFAMDPDTSQPITPSNPRLPPKFYSGGGGIVASADDYLKFAQMLVQGGAYNGARLLSPKTIQYMLSDHLVSLRAASPSTAVLGPRPGYSMGLGFAVRTDLGGAGSPGSVGMADWNGAGGTGFWIDPKEKLAVVWMTAAPGRMTYYRQIVLNRVYAALVEPSP